MGAPDPADGGCDGEGGCAAYDFGKWKEFWSFKPVRDAQVPIVRDAHWGLNDIDRSFSRSWKGRD